MRNDGKFRRDVIRYLNEYWESILSEEEIAPAFQYTTRYFSVKFKKCFGMTFTAYLKKFKLRKAAWEIKETGKLTNVGKRIGFSTPQSFSKAFGKEFGVSPKTFLENDIEVMEMPREYLIAGKEVTVRYEQIKPFAMYGYPIKPECLDDPTCTMKKAFFYKQEEKYKDLIDLACETEQIAMWWHDEQCDLYYIMGPEISKSESAPKGQIKVVVPEDEYMVFEMERNLAENTYVLANELADFAYGEWIAVNNKKIKILGYSFERYTKDKITLHIPKWKKEDQVKKVDRSGDRWIQYIEDHIQDKLDLEYMAEYFNYSYRHFLNMFVIYYDISPALYIKKRRLYLAAKEIREQKASIEEVVEKYKFQSVSAFWKMFAQEFHATPDQYSAKEFCVNSLESYYLDYNEKIRMQIKEEAGFFMMGKNVIPGEQYKAEFTDVISFIVAHLKLKKELIPQYEDNSYCDKAADRIVLWKSIWETGVSECICGPVVAADWKEMESWRKIFVKGGNYVIMESMQEKDSDTLYDTYRMLYRCAFGNWVKNNISKVDFTRITYVRYCQEKLYFYVPIIE